VPIEQLLVLKRLLNDGIRPAHIYFEILPACLCDNRLPEQIVQPARLRGSDIDLFMPYVEDTVSYRREWFFHRLDPIALSRFSILNEHASWAMDNPTRWTYATHAPTHPLGWNTWKEGSLTPALAQKMIDATEKSYHETLGHLELSERPRQYIEDFLEICNLRDIPVTLFLMPEAPSFRQWYSAESENKVHDYLADLQKRRGLPLIDCRVWGVDEAFVDGHHLKTAEARRFTKHFMNDLILPRFQGRTDGQAVTSNLK
jgi:hypothetical protein